MPSQESDEFTVLYFYGNGMTLSRCLNPYHFFRSLRCGLGMVEYPGYGMVEGPPSEEGCVAAAEALYDFVAQTRNFPPERLLVVGWSLRAAVALRLASLKEVAGVVLMSPFTSVSAMAQKVAPGFVVKAMLGNDVFDNIKLITKVPQPVLILHANEDDIVPFHMGWELCQIRNKMGLDAQLVPIYVAGHNDLFTSGTEAVKVEFEKFMNRLRTS